MLSTLTHSVNVGLEKEIEVSAIVEEYQRAFNIDTSRFFTGLDHIRLYRCQETGFRFFYPFHIAGDGKFYEDLEQFPWYYMDWKWEHETASKLIRRNYKVLEIGCARGTFLERLKGKGIDCVGLELNEKAAALGREKGIKIYDQLIQEHARQYPTHYDFVCSFQVMEHIAPIGEVIRASVEALKKGGTLVISVPNNDSFLGYDHNLLNLPPHHMGLWDKRSLSRIQDLFGIKLKRFYFEPLQAYHKEYFAALLPGIRKQQAKDRVLRYGMLGKVMNRVANHLGDRLYPMLSPNLQSFTIIAEYVKL